MARKRANKEDEESKPSRSQKKRECLALQKLGEELAALGPEERAKMNLPEDLAIALREYDQIRDKEGRRRQRQFIGRIMRESPVEEIEGVMAKRRNLRLAHSATLHKTERWRDRLLNAGEGDLERLVRELLRESGRENAEDVSEKLANLAIEASREKAQGPDRGRSRELFREISALFR